MAAPRSAILPGREVTTQLIAMLQTGLGKPVGDHDAPPGASPDVGYAIVYGIPGGEFDGPPLWAPEADGVLVHQVTSVGRTRDHAQWVGDRVRLILLSRTSTGEFQVPFPALAGWTVTHREPDGEIPGVTPEGIPPARIHNVTERYRLHVVAV